MFASAYILLVFQYQRDFFYFIIIVALIFGSVVYGSYRLIAWKMGAGPKKIFHTALTIAGISLFVFFFGEITFSLITIHQVNQQLGFRYATPETPEGEFFMITKIVPGKTMDQHGLKQDDRILMTNVNDLYILLIVNQGVEICIPVLRDNIEVDIRVNVPELRVPLAGVSFLF